MNYLDARLRTLVVVLTFLAATFLFPSAGMAKDTWTSVRTQNFFLVGNSSEREIRNVATKLEQFREVFTRLFSGARFDTPVPTTVIVFKSLDSYRPFNPKNYAGYFQPGEDVNYITLTTSPEVQSPFNIIYHEYTHQLIENTNGNVPLWFNEGLAEYYSAFKMEEDRKAYLGELLPGHLQELREEKLMPLRTLFAVDHSSPFYNESSKRGMFYAESWALIHYLILSNNGEHLPQLGKFLELTGKNLPIEDACKQAFGMDIDLFQKEIKKYIEGHNFRGQVATFEHKLEFDSEMTVKPISEAQAQGYLGDLSLHTHQLENAETHLLRALTLDPTVTMAQASLGILRAQQGKFSEAKKYLESVVSSDSNNYLAHYYYAFALNRESTDANTMVRSFSPENAARMRAELKRAIELNPTFTGSYSLLAFVDMVTGENLDDAVTLLLRALKISPGRQDLDIMLGQVYMHQSKFDLARAILQPVAGANDKRLQSEANSLLGSIKSLEEHEASYNSSTKAKDEGSTDTASTEAPGKIVTTGETGARTPPPLRRRGDNTLAGDTSTTVEGNTGQSMNPLDYLQDALRPVKTGEQRIQGLFVNLECDNKKGIGYFIVQAADRTYKIRSISLEQVQLVSFTSTGGEVGCGLRKSQDNIVITFRPTSDPKDLKAKLDGDAVAVEFVPKAFQLKK